MVVDSVPVTVEGFNWTSALIAILNVLVMGVIVGLLKAWPQLKIISNQREANILTDRREDIRDMRERIVSLETSLTEKDLRYESTSARHERDIAILRHKWSNTTQCLDALIMLLKTAPDKVEHAINMVEQMRERQKNEEAAELNFMWTEQGAGNAT